MVFNTLYSVCKVVGVFLWGGGGLFVFLICLFYFFIQASLAEDDVIR